MIDRWVVNFITVLLTVTLAIVVFIDVTFIDREVPTEFYVIMGPLIGGFAALITGLKIVKGVNGGTGRKNGNGRAPEEGSQDDRKRERGK